MFAIKRNETSYGVVCAVSRILVVTMHVGSTKRSWCDWLDERFYAYPGTGHRAGFRDLAYGYWLDGIAAGVSLWFHLQMNTGPHSRPTCHQLEARNSQRVVGITGGRLAETAVVAIRACTEERPRTP